MATLQHAVKPKDKISEMFCQSLNLIEFIMLPELPFDKYM